MEWYENLYVGEGLEEKIDKIITKLKRRKALPGIYVIAMPSNSQNLFDIYSALELMQPHYKRVDIKVVGLAKGYDNALLLTSEIVTELYNSTGAFDAQSYYNFSKKYRH